MLKIATPLLGVVRYFSAKYSDMERITVFKTFLFEVNPYRP